LAENNQCFLLEANTILTFQGHPEMSGKMAKLLMETPSMYTSDLSKEQQAALIDNSSDTHDGFEIWKRVLEWVRE
jgi:GMP synthase-like glutamine amidotransferase